MATPNITPRGCSDGEEQMTKEEEGGDMVEVVFKVTVLEGVVRSMEGEEFVCAVTGNVPALGEWNIKSCLPLKRKENFPGVWSGTIPLPVNTHLEYRYVIVQYLPSHEPPPPVPSPPHVPSPPPVPSPPGTTRSGALISLKWWESTCIPRRAHLMQSNGRVVVLEGAFGDCEGKEDRPIEEGWLVDESELQFRLTSPFSFSPTTSSILAQAFTTPTRPGDVPPRVRARMLYLSNGECEWVEQGKRGCGFDGKESVLIVFSARHVSFSQTGFILKFLAPAIPPSEEPTLIGQASLLPCHFLSGDLTHGTVHLSVISPNLQPIGSVCVDYLLINPVKGSPHVHSALGSTVDHWTKRRGALEIGHRGMGNSYRKDRKENPSVTENTIKSLKQAGESGADFVEFDVQLSSDLVPVVYHDPYVCVAVLGEGGRGDEPSPSPPSPSSPPPPSPPPPSSHHYKVLVKDLSFAQLNSLKLHHVKCGKNGKGCICRAEGEGEESNVETRPFPTLQQLLQSVPCDVGFNIEIKYPVPEWETDKYDFPFFDRNVMADLILSTVFLHARSRKIIFSCFDADMCTIFHLKQPNIPVLFLTTNHSPEYDTPRDVRSQSIQGAMMHARSQKLLGINIDSYQLLEEPSLASHVQNQRGLVLFTWGTLNNSAENLRKQRQLGVDAIIYDRVDKLIDKA